MDLQKIIDNELIEDNKFLQSLGTDKFEIVDKIKIGAVKSFDVRNNDTGVVSTVIVKERGVISYNGNEVDIPNMFKLCEKVLGVKF